MGTVRYSVSVGDKFARLTVASEVVIKRFGAKQQAFRMVECRCECGAIVTVSVPQLVNAKTKSCGCWNREVVVRRNWRHGCTKRGDKSDLYGVWSSMKTRCYNPACKSFVDYGARGVAVCDEWRDSFAAFREWALATGYQPRKLTLERTDITRHYGPDNCTWIPKVEQAWNTRQSIRITAFGETKSLPQWAADPRCVVALKVLRDRYSNQHWDFERALTTPKKAA